MPLGRNRWPLGLELVLIQCSWAISQVVGFDSCHIDECVISHCLAAVNGFLCFCFSYKVFCRPFEATCLCVVFGDAGEVSLCVEGGDQQAHEVATQGEGDIVATNDLVMADKPMAAVLSEEGIGVEVPSL